MSSLWGTNNMFMTLMRAIAALLTLATPGVAVAQSMASPFTTGHRYDMRQHLTGDISPDPDGSGLHYAAVRNTYDPAGRLVEVESGDLSAWQPESVKPSDWTGFTVFKIVNTSYDWMDRKVTESVVTKNGVGADIIHILTQYSYDALGRLECTAVRMNPAAYGSLPSSACMLGTTGSDGPDRIMRNVYDAAGQVLTVQKAYGVTTANGFPTTLQQDYQSYGYTPNGKIDHVTDANGNRAAYGYDAFDRLILWAFPSMTTPGATSTTDVEQYGYDASGNRTKLIKRDGREIDYGYDALNRMISKTFVGAGACVTAPAGAPAYICTTPPAGSVRNVYYDYDVRGLQIFARFDSTSGSDYVANVYDAAGRSSSSTTYMSGTSRKVAYAYDADGNRTQMKHPDQTRFQFGYDGLDRMTTANIYNGAQFLAIVYDTQGRRQSTTRGTSLADSTSYLYDPISRIDTETQTFASGTKNTNSTFGYNPANQITSQVRSNDAYAFASYVAGTKSYTVNGLNQYTAVDTGALGYDSNGNLAATSGTTLAYDVENRLVSATGTLSASLVYDPMGRLFQTSDPTVSNTTTQFSYDGDALIAEYNGSGTVLRRYVHGPGVDEPVMWAEGSDLSTLRFYHPDHQGSIIATATASGAPFETYTYDEYGVPGSANFANKGRFQYTGQTWIPELGMYYYKARIYSAKLGRFLQTDPIGYKDQMDLYAYVGNDPVNGRDPSGQQLLVILSGPISSNPFGHVAIAAPGAGIHSYGTPKDPNRSTTEYVKGQVQRRDVELITIPTTAAQDKAAMAAFDKFANDGKPYSILNDHSCVDSVRTALSAAGIENSLITVLMAGAMPGYLNTPGAVGQTARDQTGAVSQTITKGQPIPDLQKYDKVPDNKGRKAVAVHKS